MKKMLAVTILFLELVFGMSSLSSNSMSIVFTIHAMIGVYTFFSENASRLITVFHSYFSFVVILVFLVLNFSSFSGSMMVLSAVFLVDAFVGFYLLAQSGNVDSGYKLSSGKVTLLKHMIKPTI